MGGNNAINLFLKKKTSQNYPTKCKTSRQRRNILWLHLNKSEKIDQSTEIELQTFSLIENVLLFQDFIEIKFEYVEAFSH